MRAPFPILTALLALCASPSLAWAQTPGSQGVPPPATGAAPGPAAAAAPGPAPAGAAPAFTPGPAPAFTPPAPVALPPPVAAPAPVIPASRPSAPAGDAAERWRSRDAHLDRAVVLPTAETHPAGTWALSSYEVLVLQAAYAVSERTQVAMTFLPLFGQEDPLVPLDLSVKGVLIREGRVRVAALGSATGLIGFEEGEVFFGRAGAVTQLCFDDECRSSANVSGNLALGGPALVLLSGLGFIFRTGEHFALLAEAEVLHPLGRAASPANGMGASAGIRFSGRKLGLDIALLAPISEGEDFPPVLPFLAFTYRFLP